MYQVYVKRRDDWLFVDQTDDKAQAEALAARINGVVLAGAA